MTERIGSQRLLAIQLTVVLVILFTLVGLTWANYRYVVNDPGMNQFTPRWAATRWFLIKGLSPYSQQTSQDIQALIYGGSTADTGGGRFLYPFFALFFYVPFALIGDQNIARAIWMTVLEVAAMGVTGLGIMLNRWKPARLLFSVVLLLPLFWYYSMRAILDGDLIVLCALAIVLIFLGIRNNQDHFAGIVAALSLVEYRLLFPFIITMLIWAASTRRSSLFWSTMISLAFILIAPMIFLPDWLMQFLRQVINEGNFGFTPGAVIAYWLPGVGRQTAWILTGTVVVTLAWELIAMWGKDFRWFLWVGCLVLNATFLIGLPTRLVEYTILLPVVVLILAVWDEKWGLIGRILVVISLVLLVVGIWLAAYNAGLKKISPEVDPLLVLFTPAYLFFGLYWVKWRAIRKSLLMGEELLSG